MHLKMTGKPPPDLSPAKPWRVALGAAILLITGALNARADVLAEYFFWKEMGNAAGKAMRSIEDYRAVRQDMDRRIAAAEAELARCGGCASARAELNRWKGEENRMEETIGAILAATGTPPVIADFLDVPLPVARGRSRQEKERECAIRSPAWSERTTPACQQAVREHLACKRNYEAQHGLCSAQVALQPGQACWDTRKLVEHCAKEDYAAFEREKGAQSLRRAQSSLPEYLDDGRDKFVLYPHAPSGFVPEMPPRDVIERVFREDPQLIRIVFSLKNATSGELNKVEIKRFHWSIVAPGSQCFSGRGRDGEVSRRVCNDLDEMTWRHGPIILACWYGASLGRAIPDAVFWYGTRPEAADPAGLLSRAQGHPLLGVHGARIACPATRQIADTIERDHRQQLAALDVEQVPASVKLPESRWLTERQRQYEERRRAGQRARLDAFAIAGYYSWSTTREVGTRNRRMKRLASGHCLIIEAGDDAFDVQCQDGRRQSAGTAKRTGEGLEVTWKNGSRNVFNANTKGTALYAHQNGMTLGLHRQSDYSPAELAEFIQELPFTGRYDLELSHGVNRLTLNCDVSRNAHYVPQHFRFTCYAADGSAFHSEGIPEIRDPSSLRIANWSPPSLKVGNLPVQDLVFPLDAVEPGVAPSIWDGSADRGISARFVRADATATFAFGTPLEHLPEITPKIARSARRHGIVSLEQLAALGDEEANRIGIGWLNRRDQARRYLGNDAAASGKRTDRARNETDRREDSAASSQRDDQLDGLADRIARYGGWNDPRAAGLIERFTAAAAQGDERAAMLLEKLQDRWGARPGPGAR